MQCLPHPIQWVLDILHQHDKEAFLVGGCVRDMLMDRTIHDFDITTNALPQETMTIFQQHGCKVIPTGIKHGTVSVLLEQDIVEITTYRIEQAYIAHRKPSSVSFTNSLLEDLKRRDFTMNAIAYDPQIGFFDPFDGILDIQKATIRCVGAAKERLDEDALRILRALRFALTLQFQIEDCCANAIRDTADQLSHISVERISSEFNKILLADQPNTLRFLRSFHVLEQIFPGYEVIYDYPQPTPWHIYDIFQHTDAALNHTSNDPLENKLAIVLHDIGKPAKETFDEDGVAHYQQHALRSEEMARAFLLRLHYDHKTIDRVCLLIHYHDYYVTPRRNVLRRFLTKLDNDVALAFQILDVQRADDQAKNPQKALEKIENIEACKQMIKAMETEQDFFALKNLAINGRDLMKLGYQGKQIGEALQIALAYVLEEPSRNTKEVLLPYLKQHT